MNTEKELDLELKGWTRKETRALMLALADEHHRMGKANHEIITRAAAIHAGKDMMKQRAKDDRNP